jgi:hypothetical protein
MAMALTALACPPSEAVLCGSRTENAGANCTAFYDLCNGDKYKLRCDSISGAGVRCKCIENDVEKHVFDSSDACNVTPDTLKKRASEGCTWKLDDGQTPK